jgi:hypothetical protein
MVIENQNVLYFPGGVSTCRQALHLPEDKNLSGASARLFASRGRARHVGLTVFGGPGETIE